MRKILFIAAACLSPLSFLPSLANASAGTEGASFLDIPVGAAPAALGGAYAARADNAYATIWNPAGLARVDDIQLAGQHDAYLESISYEFAAAAIPLRPGSTLGVSAQYLGSGSITQTANDGSAIGSFSNHYGAYSLAFGQAINQALSLGLTAKWIEAQLADVHAHAFAADAGALYQLSTKISLAATVTNMGSPLTFINQSDSLPLAGKIGVLVAPLKQLNFSLDTMYRKTGQAVAQTGVEWQPLAGIFLRAGYRTDTIQELSPLAGVSAGIGLRLIGQEFDYAWVPMGDLGNSQYFSLLLKFGHHEEALQKSVALLGDYDGPHKVWYPRATVRETPQATGYPDDEQAQLKELLQ